MAFTCQREEEREENRLSEEAERSCEQPAPLEDEDEDEAITVGEPSHAEAIRPGVSYQVENESPPPACVITVPAIVTAT